MSNKTVKVLLIEDNPADIRLIREILAEAKGSPFELECADRLATGLACLARGRIDVVLLDLGLPDSQGLSTLVKVQAVALTMPVVVLTILDDEALAVEVVQEGAQDYLVKGQVDSNLLRRSIRYAIERKRAAEALQNSAENFRKIITANADSMLIVNRDGIVRFVNPAAEALFGRKAEELLGKHFGFPAVAGEITEIDIVHKGGETGVAEMRVVETEWEGERAYLASLRDITERKRMVEKLRQSEEKYSTLVEKGNDGIIIIQDGLVRFANPKMVEITGFSLEEAVGRPFIDFVSPEYRRLTADRYKKRIAGGEVPPRYELEILTKDGRKITMEVNASKIEYEKKPADIAILRDITERKQAEEALRELDRMKSEFISNISHELLAPLHAIRGFTKLMLRDKVPDPETQKEFLSIVDERSQHLGTLIESLLDMSRLESGRFDIQKQRQPIRDIIHKAVESFYSLASDKGIVISEDIPATLPEIEVDGERLEQVIANLLSNAIKFSNGGHSIIVKAEAKDDELLVQVTDHGIGIPKKAMPHLFERFYRAEDSMARGGAGLGLYISRQIIEAHGGHIWVESKVRKGTTVSFTLPLDQGGG
jgi:PAS domain S-box-containing protein